MSNQPKAVTAEAHPNIAFIKYWGNRDHEMRIPFAGSISMNLGAVHTTTTVSAADEFTLVLNGEEQTGTARERILDYLLRFEALYQVLKPIRIVSDNDFPTGAGIASSASGFAALACGLNAYFQLNLSREELSSLARLGSGSASRSIPGGYVEWFPGDSHLNSYAASLADGDHWPLVDSILVVSSNHKTTGSHDGHHLAATSVLQSARDSSAHVRLDLCRNAILNRDFGALAEVAELDSNLLHSIMLTSTPPLMYWLPATLQAMHKVVALRKSGLPCFYTVDAGPNVHVISPPEAQAQVSQALRDIPGVDSIIVSGIGGPAKVVTAVR